MSDPDIGVVGPDLEPFEPSPPNRTWDAAFETGDALLVRTRLDGDASGWHTHGDRSAYGAVREGRLRIEYGPDGEHVVAGPGEFFRIPAGVVHRGTDPEDSAPVALVALVGAGDVVVDADGPPAAPPDPAPDAAGEDDLVPTAPLANLTRLAPFPDAPVQQVRGHADGRVESEWHHHGDNDVFGYVIDGEGYVEWGTEAEERKLVGTGQFFHVPAGVVHRDVNPSDDEQDYLLWLAGSEPRTVGADAPER